MSFRAHTMSLIVIVFGNIYHLSRAEEETNLDKILNQALDAGDGANVSFEIGEMVNDNFDEFFR